MTENHASISENRPFISTNNAGEQGMCIQIAVTPTGIPLRYKTEKLPLTTGLRVTLGLSKPVDHVYTCADAMASVAERERRKYRLRLAAGESFAPVPKEHRSPQSGSTLPKGTPEDDHDGSGPRYRGCSYRNAGRKPRNKHHRHHATAW